MKSPPRRSPLTETELAAALAAAPHWRHDPERGGTIQRDFAFQDFRQAFAFMTQVALMAERLDHHPEWRNVYNRVAVSLTTHDAHGLTAKDFALAAEADRAYEAVAVRTAAA
jgi:4a-hydroxytetrahydrobiopterin dehydratase